MSDKKEKPYKWRREDYREKTRGLLIVNTGDGKGKTTCAIGLMVRAAGQGLNCCMIQFMKSKTDRYGEHDSLEKIGVEVHTMGDGFTWDTQDKAQDIKTSEETWSVCEEKLRSGDYDLLVFDELIYVLDYKFLDTKKIIEVIREVRKDQPALHIVLTGRNAPDELVEEADLVTEMKEVKHPFNAGIYAQQGIEF
ncbi:MAG: cob(I)yrinic acid a,c-diamide adenosyltransferase [Acidobacteria bacterium]|nr:MAG: cob(I)yrinic acid a,c-diamide adenosyltransferase [Acidobacteriota bacterium]REK01852.1 MAG: cob(I)yrinic acid a,c-diamide adenosyltransferase [Acidobacteriota bacterium]REK14808.1 MAG: cob(I)yrinic acid a,c-diamide adenosyltransferase [Acidobacteriota bacterium]REK45523.1 MAG: cob(I)yrinic acid a,c-diamide adenosyltransferase [Acidobacteriota bacterium]